MGKIIQFDHQQMLTVEPGKRLVELAARVAGDDHGGSEHYIGEPPWSCLGGDHLGGWVQPEFIDRVLRDVVAEA
jgi:hypothetical protein